jgi:AcrR family transcriptional regulator
MPVSGTETARERVGGIDERHRWPGMQAAGEHSRRPAPPRAAAFWLVAGVLCLLFFAAGAPSPLYGIYRLALVAEESGWSIGSIRHYFPNKDELVASALWRVGERVDDRIRHRTAGGMTMNDLRIAATELLPLDADRREDALVHLAFMAQAAVVPALADAAESAAQRLQEPLAARIAHAVQAGELPAHLDAEHEAARLRLLLDGLRLQLVTTPRQISARWALAILDDHLTALAATPAAVRHHHDSPAQRR